METLVGLSAIFGGAVYLIIAVEYALILRKSGIIFLSAFIFCAIWSVGAWGKFSLDFIYALIWSTCFILLLSRQGQVNPFSLRWILVWSVPAVSLFGYIYTVFATTQPTQFSFYLYLASCIGTLLLIEQHIRHSSGLSRVIGIGIGALFLFNLYLYSNALIVGFVSLDVIHARGLASASVGLLLLLAPIKVSSAEHQRLKVELSQPLVFTTTSLFLAGSTLLFVSTLGYILSLRNGEYAAIIQPLFFFLGVLFVGLNLASSTRRARIRVWIFKNFFHTKYDYNNEWRRLNEALSPSTVEDNYASIALKAVLPIYNGVAGTCYINRDDHFRPQYCFNQDPEPEIVNIAKHTAFFDKMLQENWIFVPAATDENLSRHNNLLPESIKSLKSILVVLPLINNKRLIGFITISGNLQQIHDFNWEDLDLLRMVGKHVANFVGNQMLGDELVVTRQFEAYHQFTTFVMHDLKNLIAQQALVVENASRFRDNPEFIADTFKTIENSVKKMNRLLLRINQNSAIDLEQTQRHPVSLNDALDSALVKCSGRDPEPTLHTADENFMVNADAYSLAMAFTHMFTNAQEACAKKGTIDIYLRRIDNNVECKIIDTGIGMEQSFIDHRLFKPFDSTKKNQGMGIGAYQYKQILSNIGGYITVSSKLGEGSCFIITLPLRNSPE